MGIIFTEFAPKLAQASEYFGSQVSRFIVEILDVDFSNSYKNVFVCNIAKFLPELVVSCVGKNKGFDQNLIELAVISKKLLFKATDKSYHDIIKSSKNPSDFCWLEAVELYSTTIIACIEHSHLESEKIEETIKDVNFWLLEATV